MDRTPGWGRKEPGGGGSGADRGKSGAAGGSWPDQAQPGTYGGSYAGIAAEAEALPCRLPDGYRMLRRVGSGRYGTVVLCREDASGEEMAVKLLHQPVEDEGTRLAAHSELLSAGAAAKHPCSVLVEDAGFTPDHHPYLVEQFCRGGNAQAKLLNSGPFPADEVILIGMRAALSVASAHRRGVLHLDVRPANILFDESGDSLLTDHGVTRVIQRCAPQLGAVFDPMYCARELFGWEKPGPAADVYGLGATLYALLNGLPAYAEAGSTSWSALYGEVMRGELPPLNRLDVPPQLFGLISRMMSVNPEGRPPLTEVHRELRLMLRGAYGTRVPALEPEPAPEPMLPGWDPADDLTPEEHAEAERIGREAESELKRRNRRRWTAAVAALVVFAGAATAMTLVLHARKKPHPSASASPSASGLPTTPREVPAAERAALAPREVTVTQVGKTVEVTWQPPLKASQVAGFAVQSVDHGTATGLQSPDSPSATQVVFTDPSALKPGTCFTVASLISVGGTVEYATAQPDCDVKKG